MTAPAPATVEVGVTYIACGTISGPRYVRVRAVVDGGVVLEDAETCHLVYSGYGPRGVPVRQFHADIRTSRGRLRRTGYAPATPPAWTGRAPSWLDPTRVHATRLLPLGWREAACGAELPDGDPLPEDAAVTCPKCRVVTAA